ncbi:hypothetical protein F4810DRAFT_694160 [Camillea tinctor]|nr:hypothetical protein F4810DRAFT_694160 [Camillea tinctor]
MYLAIEIAQVICPLPAVVIVRPSPNALQLGGLIISDGTPILLSFLLTTFLGLVGTLSIVSFFLAQLIGFIGGGRLAELDISIYLDTYPGMFLLNLNEHFTSHGCISCLACLSLSMTGALCEGFLCSCEGLGAYDNIKLLEKTSTHPLHHFLLFMNRNNLPCDYLLLRPLHISVHLLLACL